MEKQKNLQKKKAQKLHLKKYSENKIYNINIDCKKELGLCIPKEDKYTIPIFIPHRGCKNDCVFCNQRQISGEQRDVTVEDVKNRINEYLSYYTDKEKKVEIAFFGGSFTGLDISEQIKFLEVANSYINKGSVECIKISTRPDYINKEILETLKKYGVKTIELGVQSMNDEVLTLSKRGHSSNDVVVASIEIKNAGFILGHQLMVGLPNSTIETEIDSIKKCIELKPDVVRIYPVYVLKQSELYDMYLNKKYIPLKIEECITRVKAIYSECIENNINVIRIGLQVTDEINSNNEEIVGPVCDNYKERVLSSIMFDNIEKELDKKINIKTELNTSKTWKIKDGDNINIYVPSNQKNYAIGNQKENILKLERKYKVNIYIKSNKI